MLSIGVKGIRPFHRVTGVGPVDRIGRLVPFGPFGRICGIYRFSAFGRVTVVGHVLSLRQSGPERAFAKRRLTSAAQPRLASAAA